MNPPEPGKTTQETSVQVQRALAGDAAATAWIISRFTPFLVRSAHRLVDGYAGRPPDPLDLVQETWLRTLRVLPTLFQPDRRLTPIVLAFLSRTLENVGSEFGRQSRRAAASRDPQYADSEGTVVSSYRADMNRPLRLLIMREFSGLLAGFLQELDPMDFEVLRLSFLESGNSGAEIAAALGLPSANAVYLRRHRILDELRRRFPASLASELMDNP